MTEDDTFRILSRPSFDEMFRIHQAWWYTLDSKDKSLRIPFMKSYGWTWLGFMQEAARRRVSYKI
jgi:hypothetical protein